MNELKEIKLHIQLQLVLIVLCNKYSYLYKDIKHYFLGSGRHCVVRIEALVEILRDTDHDLIGLRSLSRFLRSGSACVLCCSLAAASEDRSHHAYSKDPCQ